MKSQKRIDDLLEYYIRLVHLALALALDKKYG